MEGCWEIAEKEDSKGKRERKRGKGGRERSHHTRWREGEEKNGNHMGNAFLFPKMDFVPTQSLMIFRSKKKPGEAK